MTIKNNFKFTKISPDNNIKCTLVQINKQNILFNCGSLKNLELPYIIPKVNLVLLSHSGINFSGGLVKLMSKKSNKNLKIFSTVPVKHLSKLFIHESDSSKKFFYKKQLCNSNDLDLLDNIRTIKYHEPIKINDMIITAYNCGHSIGGTVWRIQIGPDNLYVGYSINFSNENHINGFLPDIKSHSIFLTDSNYMNQNNINLIERDTILKNKINNKNKIIIPSDYARLIELLFILNDSDMSGLKINVIGNYTKTFEEYMPLFLEYSGTIAFNLLTSHRENPFICPNVKFTNKIDEESNILIPVDPEFFKILLIKYNKEDNLILIETEEKDINKAIKEYFNINDTSNELDVFEIKYPKIENKKEINNSKEESSKDEEEFFKEEEIQETLFSIPIEEDSDEFSKKLINQSNKKVNFLKKSIQMENFESEVSELLNQEENIEIFEKKYKIDFKQKLESFVFQGISNINEFFKNINSKKIQQLIFETEDSNESIFLKNLFRNQNIEIISNKKSLDLLSPYSFSEVYLNKDVFDIIKLQQYGCLQLGGVICSGNKQLNLKNNSSIKILANLDFNLIQKRLKENEINSEIKNNLIIIEDNIELQILDKDIIISCKKYNELVLQVKEILKEFIIYL